MIVESPWSEITGVEPVLRSRKVPVPWVVFASPGRRQPCPNSAADWSATAAAIGTSAPSTSALVVRDDPRVVDDLRQHRPGDVQGVEPLAVPLTGVDVVAPGHDRVRGADDVRGSPAELVHEPRVDGAERQLAGLGPAAQVGVVLEQPVQRHAGVDRRQRPAGALPHLRTPFRGQRRGDRRRPQVLPDDRPGHRLARRPVPQQAGAALVGDPDRDEIGGRDVGRLQSVVDPVQGEPPDLLGVVLDTVGSGMVLGELAVGGAESGAVAVEDQGPGARGALVDDEDPVVTHR